MDERVQAGREHLLAGERALQSGQLDDGRVQFDAALLRFRGPDVRLGEAHALRGLAQIAVATGDGAAAERRIREAIEVYQTIYPLLDRFEQGSAAELRRDAQEGEGASLVVFGELMLRTGNLAEARQALAHAREVYEKIGDIPSSASAWAATARLALNEGQSVRAIEAFERALGIHEASNNQAGQVGIWLSIAEMRRIENDLGGAEQALSNARAIARRTRQAMLQARVLTSLASLHLQQLHLDAALTAYQEALPLARETGDPEVEGFILLGLGDVQSRLTAPGAFGGLLAGARMLAGCDHHHGLATGLLRIGEHALRVGQPDLALAAAEGARRLYVGTDPVRGVGFALRVIVKALAARQDSYGVLVAAIAREAVAGAVQPNAREVAAFYRGKAPPTWLEELKPLGAKGVIDRTQQGVMRTLIPTLHELGLPMTAFETPQGALAIVETMAAKLDLELDTSFGPDPTTTAQPAILSDIPPEDEISMVIVVKPPTAAVAAAGVDVRDTTRPTGRRLQGPKADEVPIPSLSAPIPSLTAAAATPSSAPDYDDFYDPPEASDPVARNPDDDDPTDIEQLPESLRKAPPPAEYASFYDSPADDKETGA